MTQQTTSAVPVFGVNYEAGYIGFVFEDDSFISAGIAWFTRWDRGNLPPVSHTLIVTGKNACVEADAPGVLRANLTQYFAAPHAHIFFRKPRDFSAAMAGIICQEAFSHVGDKYDFALIASDAVAASFLGHWLNRWTNNWPNRSLSWLLDSRGAEVCSELAAMCLQKVPGLARRGCLPWPARMITPQQLAGDDEVFVEMANSVS
jgi:hypothetical protein